jgi:predicted transcriptional regulator of viral defense system
MRVISKLRHIRDYVNELASSGRHSFTTADAQAWLQASPDATKLALNRLQKKGLIASPARGFYVIVPAEYRSLGCLPADQFIPTLMTQLGLPYYAGVLTAAQYYGAAHQRPQTFQVCLGRNRRPIACGSVRVAYIARKAIKQVATRAFNTPRGMIQVSTPEATAIDLAGYPDHAGGLDQVATVLSELTESLAPELLVNAAETAPIPWAQRLGYLLSLGEGSDITKPLQDYVQARAIKYVPLAPTNRSDGHRDERWKLIVNEQVEPEF